MARDRLATQELQGVLDLLGEVQEASAQASHGQPDVQPPKLNAAKRRATEQNKLFAPVKIDGEDQLGRATGEEKLAMLRKKVRALEDRLRDVEDAWNTRDNELDQSRQDTQVEKLQREETEARLDKLNTFLQTKKQELDAYHERVQEALREQARREQLMTERAERAEHAEREVQEALREQARREQAALREQERREQELHKRIERAERAEHDAQEAMAEQARREEAALREREERAAEALREQERRAREALQEQARRAEELEARATLAEQSTLEVIERQKATPPPPPLVTEGDLKELFTNVGAAGRTIARVLKGEVRDNDASVALRQAYDALRASYDLLKAVRKDLG